MKHKFTLLHTLLLQLLVTFQDATGATVAPERLSYSVSDPAILSVDDNGLVSSNAIGTAQVTISAPDHLSADGTILTEVVEVTFEAVAPEKLVVTANVVTPAPEPIAIVPIEPATATETTPASTEPAPAAASVETVPAATESAPVATDSTQQATV